MNTNPTAKTVLCYGDSNTWGQMPDRSGRYGADVRWTGQLQKLLGDSCYVIEEGLGGRTTNLNDPNHVKNGLMSLVPVLMSHEPLDFVILMLGTNDLKTRFRRTPRDIADAVQELITTAKKHTPATIVVVSPLYINTKAPRFAEFYEDHYDDSAYDSSRLIGELLETVARKEGCAFLDAGPLVQAGEDGLHFDEASHAVVAKAVYELLTEKVSF